MRQRRPLLGLLAAAVTIPLVGSGLMAASAQADVPSLRDPIKREIAQEIITSAENSRLDWYNMYGYIEDIDDGRGYTGGIIGFTSGTSDMLELVERYTNDYPNNDLAEYLPALRAVDGSESHAGLGDEYMAAWEAEGNNENFKRAQRDLTHDWYFEGSVDLGLADGLGALGQFIYYDAAVVHGFSGMEGIRDTAMSDADTPAEGGSETAYLNAFLDARVIEMQTEAAHEDVTRIETAQRLWLNAGNFDLDTPLNWAVYGEDFAIPTDPQPRWPASEIGGGTGEPEPEPGGTAISQDRPVTASSVEDSTTSAANAVDGSASTRWASVEGIDPQWIQVDLGAGAKVDDVVLKWEAAYASDYRIEISDDGSNWTVLAAETAGNGGTDEHVGLDGTGRYLRVYGTARGTAYGYSLFEVEVYGTVGGEGGGGDDGGGDPGTPTDVLISKNNATTTSSVENSTVTGPNAVDGDATSRWASAEGVDPQWIRVDLGAGAKVSSVILNWEAAYASQYRIETSDDGSAWTLLADETAGNGGTDEHADLNGAGRYLRVYGTARGTAYGYSLYELEVYGTPGEGGDPDPEPDPGAGAFTVVGAGDIAGEFCTTRGVKTADSDCEHFETADRAQAINPAFYITFGDMQYDDGHLSDFTSVYDKSWGKFKNKTWPVPGNHESYDTDWDDERQRGDEAAYRAYFGDRATPEGKMWYSYDYGNWHFIALNSNRLDEQEQIDWLTNDLATNTKQCTVAYYHHPVVSSGEHGSVPYMRPIWKQLANAGVELVLNGHDHHYERFAPMDGDLQPSPTGTVEIISGLGGHEKRDIPNIRPNSVKRINSDYGVSQLDFTDTSVVQKFVSIDGTVLDTSPVINCH